MPPGQGCDLRRVASQAVADATYEAVVATWSSTGIDYEVDVESEASDEEIEWENDDFGAGGDVYRATRRHQAGRTPWASSS
jgi:hypothetical protein